MSSPLTTTRVTSALDFSRLRQVSGAIFETIDFGSFLRTRAVTTILEVARATHARFGNTRVSFALSEAAEKITVVVRFEVTATADQNDPFDDIVPAASRKIAESCLERKDAEKALFELSFKSQDARTLLVERSEQATTLLSGLAQPDLNAELVNQNLELLRAIEARDLMMEEVHHRTRNNLTLLGSLVRLNERRAQSEEAKMLMNELSTKISAISAVHQQLQVSETYSRVILSEFVGRITENSSEAFNDATRAIAISAHGGRFEVDAEFAIDLGLVIGELITNAFKHAFKDRKNGKIDIDILQDAKEIEIYLKDDGAGLADGNKEPQRSNSLGWRMIRSVVQKYEGKLSILTDNGFGVRMIFSADKHVV